MQVHLKVNRFATKKWTKLLALSLAVSAVISACGSKEPSSGGSTATPNPSTPSSSGGTGSSSSDVAGEYKLPFVSDGSVTLTVATFDNWYTPKSYAQNLPVWQEVEKNTGVKIKWDVAPASQYQNAMNVRLAAASDLPDIINLPGDPVKLGTDGLIIPLDELIDKHAPNIKKFYEENPDIYNLAKAPDGHIYGISSVTTGAAYTDPYGFLIRKDWLDKLNLQEPTTLEEWYTVLKAFKEGDPNGNGIADEIPISPQYSLTGLTLFGNALGLHLSFYGLGYSVDDNGKVQFDWLNPKAKELVEWLHKLYAEGLIDPEFMTKKNDKVLADISREMIGATNHFLNNASKYNSAIQSGQANWINTVPPAQSGVEPFYEKYGPISGYYGISKDSRNPEIAIKWLDYIYASEEGARLVAIGIEGLSYEMVDGKPQFTDFVRNNPDGLDPANALRSIGAFPVTPWIRTNNGVYAEQSQLLLELIPSNVELAKKVEPYLADGAMLDFILPSPEELEQYDKLGYDIPTYIEETIVKFIVGREPIDWDGFTSKLKALKIDEIVALKQQQYDRFAGK